MLDINLLRNDLPAVAASLAHRGVTLDSARFEALERERKDIQTRTQDLQAKRNALSKQIGVAKGKGEDASALLAEVAGLGDETKRLEGALDRVQLALRGFLLELPNLTHASTPVGKSEADNVEVRRWGTPRTFDFTARDHTDIGENLGCSTSRRPPSSRVRGFRSFGAAWRALHRALAQFMLDTHTREHGYTECYTPYIVNAETLTGTSQLPKFETEMFSVKKGGAEGEGELLYLISTSEVTLTGIGCRRNPAAGGAADQVDGAHAVLPVRGRKLRKGHARDDPPAPVRQGRDGAGRAARDVLRRARGNDAARGDDPAAAGAAVSRGGAVHRRHRVPSTKTYDLEVWLPGRARIARSRRYRTARRSRRGGCRPAIATRRESPNSSTRSTAPGSPSAGRSSP